jgi:hypothetical protein
MKDLYRILADGVMEHFNRITRPVDILSQKRDEGNTNRGTPGRWTKTPGIDGLLHFIALSAIHKARMAAGQKCGNTAMKNLQSFCMILNRTG